MRLALFRFYVPAGKCTRVAGVSAGVTLVLLVMGVYAPLVPLLACLLAWVVGKCGAQLVVQPLQEWQRAWPVPENVLYWTRVLAAWCLGWTGLAASLAMSSALTLAGVLSLEQWLGAFAQTLCLLGVTTASSSVAQHTAPGASATGVYMALLILGGVVAPMLSAKMGFSAAAMLGVLLSATLLAVAVGIIVLDDSVPAPAAAPAPPVRPATRLAPRARWLAVPWFFYSRGPGQPWTLLTWAAAVLFATMAGGGLTYWMLTCMFFVTAHLDVSQPSPLLAHWPVSRDHRLVLTLAPLCLLGVCVLGIRGYTGTQAPAQVFSASRDPAAPGDTGAAWAAGHRRLFVPSMFWRATLTEPPLVPSADGELVRAPSQRVFQNLPLRVYNPFDAWLTAEPAVFYARVSQLLRDEWHLDVTEADVDYVFTGYPNSGSVRSVPCPRSPMGATCHWPWMWLALMFWVLALIPWAFVKPLLRTSPAPGRWSRYTQRGIYFLGLLLVLLLLLSLEALQSYEPGGWSFFGGAVLLGELVRLCQRAPLFAFSTGLGVLIALYWNLVRSYRRAELKL